MYCVCYSGMGKGSIWDYLGLNVKFNIFLSFSKLSSQRLCTFNFHQKIYIFTKQIIFLSDLLFSLIKVLQHKMIPTAHSILTNNHRHNKSTFSSQLNLNFLTNNVKGLLSSKRYVKIFECFRNKVAPKGVLF